MKVVPRSFAIIALSLTATTLLLAQAPKLNVQLGYWELNMTTNIAGDMPGMPDMSKMTDDQRTKMAAAMQGMMGAHSQVTHSCLTREDLDQSKFFESSPNDTNCTRTFTTNTATTLEGNETCTGDNPRTSHIRLDALSPTAFKGSVNSTDTEQGKTMKVAVTMTGKWVGASCPADSKTSAMPPMPAGRMGR